MSRVAEDAKTKSLIEHEKQIIESHLRSAEIGIERLITIMRALDPTITD